MRSAAFVGRSVRPTSPQRSAGDPRCERSPRRPPLRIDTGASCSKGEQKGVSFFPLLAERVSACVYVCGLRMRVAEVRCET